MPALRVQIPQVLASIVGVIMFGHSCHEFANFYRAFMTCMYITMGEVDLEVLEIAGGKFYAGMWVFTFFTVVVLLMLNMLLVIIFENYSKALSNVGPNAKTLSFQLYEALRRVIQAKQGKRVPLPHTTRGWCKYCPGRRSRNMSRTRAVAAPPRPIRRPPPQRVEQRVGLRRSRCCCADQGQSGRGVHCVSFRRQVSDG